MKRLIVALILLATGVATSSEDWRAENRKSEASQVALWDANLAKSAQMTNLEKLDFLALGLRNMGERKTRPDHSSEVDALYDSLQSALLAIPGHAESYRDRINETRSKMEEARRKKNASEANDYQTKLSNQVFYDLPTLDHLPSVETVGVLGEFLFDERGYVRLPPMPTLLQLDKAAEDSPVYGRAARALAALPIENKPVPADAQFFTPEDVFPWRQWFEEIKSGKRTFRFEGDPTEYDLNGPAPKQKLERIALDHKRDAERATGSRRPGSPDGAGVSPNTTEVPMPTSIAALIASCLLLAGAVWYFVRAGKRWLH